MSTRTGTTPKKTPAHAEQKDKIADVAGGVFHGMYRSWSLDTLLAHPRDAIRVCQETARQLGRRCTEEFEHEVCRALLNARKHGDLRRDPA